MKVCKLCEKPTKTRGFTCNTCVSRIRRYRFKIRAVELLGGCCSECGFSGHISALEFHHPDNNKSFTIAKHQNKAWDTVVKELLKCKLICSNCHRIEHTGVRDEKFLEIANASEANRLGGGLQTH